jgi:plasmid stabilization system protein ParE
LIEYTPEALRQVDALLKHYEERQRDGAARALLTALRRAEKMIECDPYAGLSAPRPYPQLVQPGLGWVKPGRYWIAYTATMPPIITGGFFEASNIPGRI